MPPMAHRGNSWQGYARTHKHRRMRSVALVTAGHTTGLRGRKLRMELKNQTWLLIQVAQVRLTEVASQLVMNLLFLDIRFGLLAYDS
jgi:hypothetical protein